MLELKQKIQSKIFNIYKRFKVSKIVIAIQYIQKKISENEREIVLYTVTSNNGHHLLNFHLVDKFINTYEK